MLFNYKYGGQTNIVSNANETAMSFAPDTLRQPTFFVGKLNKKISFREAISALHHVVVSDLRFKPKDKTAYKEWAAQQEAIWLSEYVESLQIDKVNERVGQLRQELNEVYKEKEKYLGPFNKAKRAYFDYLYEKDKDAWFVLDPVITVHPDEVFFECFSQDESTYGKLSCSYNVFTEINEFACGTTNIDYSSALYNEFQKIRDYKETDFKIDPSGFEVQTTNEDTYKEVKIDLPDSWVRGFLQVSSAMTLPATTFYLHPLDVFSLCQFLRRFKEKASPRSLRFILEPDKPIKIIVEPWNEELIFRRSLYTEDKAQEIRLWGRRRLLILERLIPIAKTFKVVLLGSGLPSFFIADLENEMSFTLGLSGWTANDWSGAGNFDLMAPRMEIDAYTQQKVFNALKQNWFETSEALALRLHLDNNVVASALAAYTQVGRVIYDLNLGVYRVRELSREPLPMEQLRFASPQEEKATKLLKESKVQVSKEQKGNSILLKGKIVDTDKTFHTTVLIDNDERIVDATCECSFFSVNKLRKGPCEHILATRMHENTIKI
ncbi:MAG: SWIM zinc finger family protein [Thermonemataceae bacterium]|nr:SWIM zinc finger family protein [Thermonemataceae bacterium]